MNAELEAEARPQERDSNRSRGSFTGRQCQQRGVWGSEGGSLPTTEPVFPPSYCRSKAKNYTCFIVSSFQGIL